LIAAQFAARVPITVVRPPIVFGEGDLQMRDVFRSIFRFGVHVALGVAGSRYSMIHVKDLVEALVLCGQRGTRLANGSSDSPSGYYFTAMDEQPTVAELGSLIAECLGRERVRVLRSSGPSLLVLAAGLAEVMARLRGTPYIFNFDKAREARAGNWTCSPQTIRRELGFAPRLPFVDRLRQTTDWYRQQNLL
jgi:nucleoside-diphosphate-sugar epimerase